MMKSFLEYVAEDIIRKYGTDLSRTVVVFPNKRASLFLNDYLARQTAGKPLWSPQYITISELFRQLSPLAVADPIKLVCDLYQSFCLKTGSDETLDKFFSWGQLLLSDFDDIDKNMADADKVFANLRDIHELDDMSFLTKEQRELLQRFFSHFTEEHESELKQRFLRLWSRLADIYHDFHRRLSSQGLAYEGALYRHAVENIATLTCVQDDSASVQDAHASVQDDSASVQDAPASVQDAPASVQDAPASVQDDSVVLPPSPLFPADRYLFVGFNLLQKVEQQLFSCLQKQGKAHFYWDFDHYYLEQHEAGRYISQYLKYFPNELDVDCQDIYDNFRQQKHITFLSAPTEHVQARYVSTWLREQNRYADGRRTAVVLCNENLLQTVVHCLPDEVEKVNVTTGYPLSQTPVASFIRLYFDMMVGGRSPRLVRLFKQHPYTAFLSVSDDTLPEPADTPTALTSHLLASLRQIAQSVTTADGSSTGGDPLFQESLFRAYTLINRIHSLIECGDLLVSDNTLQRLVDQLVQQTTIPFHGEPAEGVQVMGVLETRNLDFDHVLLLSCNEGNMPKGINDSSFIPHAVRQAYELTTVENKVGIYAYYFHRLLQRAGDMTLLWNNSTDDGQRGEMSRFMLQILVESGQHIQQHTLQADRSSIHWKPETITKTPRVMKVLHEQFFKPSSSADTSSVQAPYLSPTAINRYMRCPLQFYYRYVAGVREPDQLDDEQELDNRIFGNIFHDAADIIYHQLPNRITRPLLEQLLKNKIAIERAVDEAFHRQAPTIPVGGLHLINREVIIRYLRQLIEIDIRLAPFTIIGLEHDVFRTINSQLKIGGRIDRLDLIHEGTPDERIRVVDYKTGSRLPKPLPDVEAIFDPAQVRNHADYYLQTFVYADIVRRQYQKPVSPALLFIQHAAADGYDPTLLLGKQPILDIADYSEPFNMLLEQKVAEIFSPENNFIATTNTDICRNCPYVLMCRR